MLILRNRDLSLGNVHTWVVPPCHVVDLLIHRNRVFRFRNVQIWVVLSQKLVVLLIFKNSVFLAAKLSDMDCVELQGGLFVDCQEWNFQVSKRSDYCRTVLQEGRFADVH